MNINDWEFNTANDDTLLLLPRCVGDAEIPALFISVTRSDGMAVTIPFLREEAIALSKKLPEFLNNWPKQDG